MTDWKNAPEWSDNNTPPNPEGADKDGDKNNNNQDGDWKTTVSVEEFKSLQKSNQEAQKLIKQFRKEKQERENSKKEKEKEEMEKKWEWDKLKADNETEKTNLKDKITSLESDNTTKTEFIKWLADKELSWLKDLLGDKYDDVKKIVWDLEDPLNVLNKIPLVKKLLINNENIPWKDWGIPKGNKPDRLKELRDKKIKEWLSRQEQKEFQKLVFTKPKT